MKRRICSILIVTVLLCMFIPAIAISVAAESSFVIPDVPEDQCSDTIRLEGNFHFTGSLVLSASCDGTAYLDVYLFDGESQETSWNVVNFTQDNVRNLRTEFGENNPEKRWEETDFTKGKPSAKNLYANTTYQISLHRWKERILLRITDEDGSSCRTLLYKAKADVADTLYLQLSPGASTLTKVEYSIGETQGFGETFLKNESWVTWIGVIVVLLLLLINFLFGVLEKRLLDTSFNIITGGLWGISVTLSVCLIFPAGRDFLNSFIHKFLGIGWITIPGPSSFWYWLLLILAIVYTLGFWLLVALDSDISAVGATVVMLLLGALHGFSLLVMVGILVYAVIAVFVIVLLVGMFSGSGGASNSSSTSDPPPTTEEKKVVKVWREDANGNREYMKVGTSGECYQDPDTGEWHRIK